MKFSRITVDPQQMGGVACLRGLRIPLATIVGMVADGMRDEEILAAYPDLEPEDIGEALRYAAEAVRERELPLRPGTRGSWSTTRCRRWSPRGCDAQDTMRRMSATTASRWRTTSGSSMAP